MISSPSALAFDHLSPTIDGRDSLVVGGDVADAIEVGPDPADAPVGLYVHVPFCAHICPYCDFNTYAGQAAIIPRYVDALVREIACQAPTFAGRTAATIFFGGGTPSLLTADQVGRIVAACRDAFALALDAEITLEANPNGLDAAACEGLLQAGINRLSIGVQTLDHRGLRRLGRLHEAADAATAIRAARDAGFDNLSLDLIFGWPGQTVDAWRRDLAAVLGGEVGGSRPDHLSLYGLIVEPGTPMADAVARGVLAVPDDDASADLYEEAIAALAAAGFLHYEVANWAAAPHRFSRHNLIYWRNGDYAGLGAGAHGHLRGRRHMNHLLPKTYCEAVEQTGTATSNVETISETTARGETMMLGLRLPRGGVGEERFRRRHGLSLDDAFGDTITELIDTRLLERAERRLRLTPRGLMLANDVCARFL